MLLDGRRLVAGETHQAEICIVGAGAAGITLALELSAKGHDVILLESGGFETDAATESLNDGSAEGSQPSPGKDYLRLSRSRLVGGTTNRWEGWCRPFAPLDFAPREWVPHSGWPIDRQQLDPYYERAWQRLRSDRWHADVAADSRLAESDQLFSTDTPFRTIFLHRPPPLRFGTFHQAELVASPKIRLFLWSNAVEIVTNQDATAVEAVRVAVVDGPSFRVSARYYCLAAGGIETPRLLLVSNAVQAAGLGNRHDLVGRYFMDHPYFESAGGLVWLGHQRALRRLEPRELRPDYLTVGALAATEEAQREHRLLQTCIGLQWNDIPEFADGIGALANMLSTKKSAPVTTSVGTTLTCEQSPNPESRVVLTDTKDALGVAQVRLQWRLSDVDNASLRTWIILLAREFGRTSRGRIATYFDDDDPWRDVLPSAHHMGTTRMSDAPERGVVDANLRLHGIDNLFIASSSTFPTGGLVSPTPTIVALAIRLADHLAGKMR